MKKIIQTPVIILILFFTGTVLNSCVKDTCKSTNTYTIYTPVYETLDSLKQNIKNEKPENLENPGKIVILGKYIFCNEIEKGIHIIDNENPASPRNIAFINIPGNMDLALKGNTLYADSYTDLVTIDISNPTNVILKEYTENVFPFLYYQYGMNYNAASKIASWNKKDTTVSQNCGVNPVVYYNTGVYFSNSIQNSSVPSASASNPVGTGGSMARFAIVNNYLYTVDDYNLNIFDITNNNNPTFSNKVSVDYHVETIYPFDNKLFIGSNNGMFIYNIESTPGNPVKSGEFTHARACDPVIADGEFAFITLHSGTTCLGYNNQLDVVKLNNLVDASLVKIYNLTSPQGLSKDGNLLFICDGTDGLKIFDATDVSDLKQIKQFPNLETYDAIASDNIALVSAKDGLYQYDYSDINNIHLVSKIAISNQ